jgi:hypothetical protein
MSVYNFLSSLVLHSTDVPTQQTIPLLSDTTNNTTIVWHNRHLGYCSLIISKKKLFEDFQTYSKSLYTKSGKLYAMKNGTNCEC